MCRKRIAGRWPALEREVADEWVQQHVLETCTGRACTICCSQKSKDIYCSTVLADLCYYLIVMPIIVIGITLLIMFGVLNVAPHLKSASYKATTCTVSSIQDQEVVKCTCGKLCYSKTICVKINVKYNRDDGRTVEGLLHVTDGDLDARCTIAPCLWNNLVDNKQKAKDEARGYYVGHSFSCLYDPLEGSTKVIMRRMDPNDGAIIEMMVWPSVVMLLGIASCLFLCCTCGSKYACSGKVPPRHVLIIAAQLRRQGIVELYTLPVEERRRLLRECAPEPAELPFQNIQRA